MKLLILGGTRFFGRHLVDAALARGHQVTTFNRGRRDSELSPAVEKLHGDRHNNLTALQGRSWDAVIDSCGFVPSAVESSVKLLADSVGHYTFISSISAYADFSRPGLDESTALGTLTPEELKKAETVRVQGDVSSGDYARSYGPLKALCEQAAQEAMPGRVLNIRPGLLVGPLDYTGRFSYWPKRIARGGEVLAPGRPGRQVQFIDARDLATWTLHMAETGKTGALNATGPEHPLTMEQLLDECLKVTGSDAQLRWVEDSFLEEAEVAPATEMPLWIPDSWKEWAGFMTVDCSKALAAGLTYRPLEDTIRQTLEWESAQPQGEQKGAAMTAERETEMLDLWHSRSSSA